MRMADFEIILCDREMNVLYTRLLYFREDKLNLEKVLIRAAEVVKQNNAAGGEQICSAIVQLQGM